MPLSKTCTVAPDSAAPPSVIDVVFCSLSAAGVVIVGAAGAIVSTVIVRVLEEALVLPTASFALAVYGWAPSARPLIVRLHVVPLTVACPFEVAPSKTSTVEPASVLPPKVTDVVFWSVSPAGVVIVGAFGGVVSTVNGREGGEASIWPARSTARTKNV